MSEADDPQIVMPPKEAARRLRVAASTLRRLAPTYEAVHGPLPWEGDEAGGGRLWPGEAVERVQAARALVAEGRAKSLESALRALAGGAPPPSGVLSRPDEAAELVEALRAELEAVRRGLAEIPALREEVAALRSELGSQRSAQKQAESHPPSAHPVVFGNGGWATDSADEATSTAQAGKDRGDGDGPMVRAVRWLERLLRGGR